MSHQKRKESFRAGATAGKEQESQLLISVGEWRKNRLDQDITRALTSLLSLKSGWRGWRRAAPPISHGGGGGRDAAAVRGQTNRKVNGGPVDCQLAVSGADSCPLK